MRALCVMRTLVIVAAVFCVSAPADAQTIATFADPAVDGSTPLFELDDTSFTGGWDGTVPDLPLDLEMPLTGDFFPDATFEMSPLTVLDDRIGTLSGGWVEFFDNDGGSVLLMTFDSAQLSFFGWGASEWTASEVMFYSDLLESPLDQQQFAFAFSNRADHPDGSITWTAAFTASAIPEPAGIALLLLGLPLLRRRR